MKLIDDVWAKFTTLWTVRIQGAVIALAGGWALAPQAWQDSVPKWALVGLMALFAFATISARVVKQQPPGSKGE